MLLHTSNGKDCKSVEKKDYTIGEATVKKSTLLFILSSNQDPLGLGAQFLLKVIQELYA